MAKIKNINTIQTELENEKTEYESWVADTVQKNIPLSVLEHHPENFSLVGHIDDTTKAALKEDILKNGIREPLQVIYQGGKLFVISGNERLIILNELGRETAPCIKKEFKTESEILQHIYATNKNRKTVKIPKAELLEKLFPLDDYPLLYVDLRGTLRENKTYFTDGKITFEKDKKTIEKQRAEKEKVIKKAAIKTGMTPGTVRKTASIIKKEKQKIEKPELTPEQIRANLPAPQKRKLEILENRLTGYKEKLTEIQNKIKETEKKIIKLLK